jgi:hypothetical protein
MSIPKVTAVLTLLFTSFNCGSDNREKKNDQFSGPRSKAILLAARTQGINERALLTASWVQSQFGLQKNLAKANSNGSDRTSVFDVREADFKGSKLQDLGESASALAQKIKELAKSQPPKDGFDWLVLTSTAVVGDVGAAPLKEISLRITLTELINTYNAGFTAILPENEVFVMPAAHPSERIELAKLNKGQSRYLVNDLRYGANTFVEGPKEARREERDKSAVPRILLRSCPGSALRCFDALRNSTETPVHALLYRGKNGERDFLQFHPIGFDLNWYGETAKNVITIAVSGLAGSETPETMSPDWLDWEDYVSISQSVREIYQNLRGDLPDEVIGSALDPANLKKNVLSSQKGVALPDVPTTPAASPEFALPTFWDQELFQSLLALEAAPKPVSKIQIESPKPGQVFAGPLVTFALFPDPESAWVEVYQDERNPQFGKSWDLILKRDYAPNMGIIEFRHSFKLKGATKNKGRAIKVVSKNINGQILGSRIIKFGIHQLN